MINPGRNDLKQASWRKSRFSGNQGNCIEVADGLVDIVPVRDSKDPGGPALVFPADAWTSFVAAIKTGELPTA
ncbi:DUF397 domain-containing protein [Kitasatospora sp. NPDC017646]|uniref:DUF397 domain-containing protein n=1 Tax=Kitasatospora sp. NPDC017646 TaxID=3364024 RepID=UPI0037BCFCAC